MHNIARSSPGARRLEAERVEEVVGRRVAAVHVNLPTRHKRREESRGPATSHERAQKEGRQGIRPQTKTKKN